MKKISVILSLLFGFAASAQSYTNLTASTGNNTVFSVPVSLNSLNFVDTSGANNLVILYDSSSGTNIVSAAFTNYVFSTISFTNTYTDQNGYTNNFIYTLGTNTPTVVAAATNEARRVFIGQVPPNGQFVYTPARPQSFGYGLVVKTTGAGLGIVSYQKNP
jgi:hypothetical protein